jgi:hypothetical protein
MEKIEIKALPVEIKVITIAGKRMTKSVLEQIPRMPFDEFDEHRKQESGFVFLGYVKSDKGFFIIYHCNGLLLKTQGSIHRVASYLHDRYKDAKNVLRLNPTSSYAMATIEEYEKESLRVDYKNSVLAKFLNLTDQVYISI